MKSGEVREKGVASLKKKEKKKKKKKTFFLLILVHRKKEDEEEDQLFRSNRIHWNSSRRHTHGIRILSSVSACDDFQMGAGPTTIPTPIKKIKFFFFLI